MSILNIDHGNRMMDYYPDVIKAIQEFKAIVNGEGLEFDNLQGEVENVLNNAHLSTMLEDRIIAWENLLEIQPLDDSTLDDRRDTILARVRGQGKLNSKLINTIVNAFTGGTANSWVRDSVLYVEITPPPSNKSFRFENVEQEIGKKIPAHMGFKVSRNYLTWEEVKNTYANWQGVKNEFETWNDVKIFTPFKEVR